MIKVSVVIPVYNMENYIQECLDSVINQSLSDIELIIVNDGSTDNSLDIIHEYQNKDKRIIVINKKNEGVGAARNDGIKAATGEFVAFIDPDDMYMHKDVLLHCYEAAVREHVFIAGGKLAYLYKDGSIKEELQNYIGNILIEAKGLTEYKDYQYDYGYYCFIYKREMLIENNIFFPLYSRFQDPPFFVKAMIIAEKFYALDECVYLYRQLPGSSKYTPTKTIDFLNGLMDNLVLSKKYNLSLLHYICAKRLDSEGSYMALNNLNSAEMQKIICLFVQATSMVDVRWLMNEGFLDSDIFLPEMFDYMLSTSKKYEALRKNVLLRKTFAIYSRFFK